jgi:hypothetical protein
MGEGESMIFAALVSMSLLVPASVERDEPLMLDPGTMLSADQKAAAVRPLVSKATDCIAHTVSADPRFSARKSGAAFNNLIVDSVPSCVEMLRSMIDTYDRIYGAGAGESYFSGPYLDELPAAVTRRVKDFR